MKGWRTVAFNVLSTAVPLLSLTEWHSVIPEGWLNIWMLCVALANVYLRLITTGPVGTKW